MSMAERVARKACLFAPLASRYIAKKIEAIEPKRVPTAPEKKLAAGRSTAGGTGGGLPGGRGDNHRGKIARRGMKGPGGRGGGTGSSGLKKKRAAAEAGAAPGRGRRSMP